MKLDLLHFDHVSLYNGEDHYKGTYYINIYTRNPEEGFYRRNTIASCLTLREAERLVKAIKKTVEVFRTLNAVDLEREYKLLNKIAS